MNQLIKLILLVAIIGGAPLSYGQEFTGVVKDFESKTPIAFANVDVYQGSSLKASTYTNSEGRFSLRLDSGAYRCEIISFGYFAFEQSFKLAADVEMKINLKADPSIEKETTGIYERDDMAYSTMEVTEDAEADYDGVPAYAVRESVSSPSRGKGKTSMGYYSPDIMPRGDDRPQVGSGLLTAGEVNDFSKWDLWTDIASGDLANFQQLWNLVPNNRFMFEVVNAYGIPIANMKVQLIDESGKMRYAARTDNTGKAELWASLLPEEVNSTYRFKTSLNGKDYTLDAKSIDEGENRLVLDDVCEQSNTVDIAFVVDATGSMGDELEFLKAELNNVMLKAKSIDDALSFRFANVFYRDHTDAYLTPITRFYKGII